MSTKDPRKIYAQPPYPEKKQPSPVSDEEMSPEVDHGESSYKGTGRLQGRHALITGADSGIGRAVALAFAREGADVAISYLSEETDARNRTSGYGSRSESRPSARRYWRACSIGGGGSESH